MKYMYCCGTQLINLEDDVNQKQGLGYFWCDKCGAEYRSEIYPIYSQLYDITFIMEDLSICYDIDEDGTIHEEQVVLDSEVMGCYKGKPTDENTNKYFKNLNIRYFKSKEDIEINKNLPKEIKNKIEKYISGGNLPDNMKTMCEIVNK